MRAQGKQQDGQGMSEMESIRVALVEDSDDTRQALAILISGSPGYDCVAACVTGEEALGVLPEKNPQVVLMDIQLPGMSGIECIAKLKELIPATQIVMLTVLEDHERIFQSIIAGASGYLVKKTLPARLLEAIREVNEGGAPMSSQIARQVVDYVRNPAPVEATHKLSPRETEVLHLLAKGFLYKEIGDQLGISISTVRIHIRHIYDKLHVRNRTEAVMKTRNGGSLEN